MRVARHYGPQAELQRREAMQRMLRAARRPRRVTHRYTDQVAIEAQRARIAQHRTDTARRAGVANHEVETIAHARGALGVSGSERDGDLLELAQRRADYIADQLDGVQSLDQLNALVCALDARPFAFRGDRPEADQLAGMLKRARCADWWTRQLRRAAARRHEADAIRAGRVCRRTREVYCTDFAVRRRARSNAAAARMLASTEIENEAGEVVTLKACFEASTSHKPLRRGELMTRIRGCEEWADERGMVGVFLTLTAPSRFHSQGGENVKYEGATPRDAQQWLCEQWGRARAALQRAGVEFYGFRVAEPHRDGCPHWHALVWVADNAAAVALCMLVRRYWLQWDENEAGAREHRCKAVRMHAGGASGYIAKYIAKNIDDVGAVGVEGHRDEWESDGSAQADLFGGTAARVDAWASTWGIRQFQALGQPPVTVWRELRRVDREREAQAPLRVSFAMNGAHRVGDERACWHTFLKAMGGVNVGRDYLIRVAVLKTEHEGRYETIEKAKPLGVYEAGNPAELVPSVRREWRPRGGWARGNAPRPSKVAAGLGPSGRDANPRRVPPWTRFNNCTREPFAPVVSELLQRLEASRYRPTFDPEHAYRHRHPDPSSLEPLF